MLKLGIRVSKRTIQRHILTVRPPGDGQTWKTFLANHKRAERQPLWLLMEWENGNDAPSKFHLISLPEHLPVRELVRNVKQRWRTERAYEDMKGQLGLDHFEGRRFRGWHHHISVVLACYAFILAEHARLFPPAF